MNAIPQSHEEVYAVFAPQYRKMYAKRSIASCDAAIRDINETLKLHERSPYTGKLYAELDAARDRKFASRLTKMVMGR